MNILYADDRPVAAVPEPCDAIKGKNCRNCGAPLIVSGDCEYCGTKRQYHSSITITVDKIQFSCG